MTSDPTIERLQAHLSAVANNIPTVWRQAEAFRLGRGINGLPNWPAWCYLPLAASYAILSTDRAKITPNQAAMIGPLGALIAWRATQGIYRFDPDVFCALWESPVEGRLPIDELFCLPEWCVYIECTQKVLDVRGRTIYGFFSFLEFDPNNNRSELRIILDTESDKQEPYYQIILHLIPGATIESAIGAATEESIKQGNLRKYAEGKILLEKMAADLPEVGRFISLILYLCSSGADISGRDGAAPKKPKPVKTKNGLRLFPPSGPTAWEVGYRVGAAMRHYAPDKPAERGSATGTHAAPRPHIRRAHWHTYILGKKAAPEKTRRVYWLPPIPVGVAKNLGIIPTIKKIAKGKNYEEKK